MAHYPYGARRSGNLLQVDPCPVCNVPQAQHWRCARCGSRGHILGHSDPHSRHCDDCRAELARQSRQEAA